MDFDLDVFTNWIIEVDPLCVFLGYNSHPDVVHLPEPSIEKTFKLAKALEEKGVKVLFKDMRGYAVKHAYRDFFS
jgi:hypothetical protein